MSVYLSSRVGRHMRVGVRLDGRRNSLAEPFYQLLGFSVAVACLYLALVLLPFLALLFGGIVVLGMVWGVASNRMEKRATATRLGQEAETLLTILADRRKLTPARQHHLCDEATVLLKKILQADPNGAVVGNARDLLAALQSVKKTVPLVAPLNRLDRAEFKRQRNAELNACLDLLFLCRTERINDGDLACSGLCFGQSGEPLSLERLRERCVSMGWSEDDSSSVEVEECVVEPEEAYAGGVEAGVLPPPAKPTGDGVACPYCNKVVQREWGMVMHLKGTVAYGGHEFSEQEARRLAKRLFAGAKRQTRR